MKGKQVLAVVIVVGIFTWSLSLVALLASMFVKMSQEIIDWSVLIVIVGCAVYVTMAIMAMIAMRAKVL